MGGCIPFYDSDIPNGNDDVLKSSSKRRKNKQLFVSKLKQIELHLNSHPNITINRPQKAPLRYAF